MRLFHDIAQVYGELQRCLDERVSEEQRAVEAAMTIAEECIDGQSAIEHEWKIQVRCHAPTLPPPSATSKFVLAQVVPGSTAVYVVRCLGRQFCCQMI